MSFKCRSFFDDGHAAVTHSNVLSSPNRRISGMMSASAYHNFHGRKTAAHIRRGGRPVEFQEE